MRPKENSLNATGKIIAVLECAANEGCNKKIKEISELLEMDRSTVYRLVEQLAEQKMLKINPDTKRVTVGVKAFQIGTSFLHNGIIGEQIKYLIAKTSEKYPMAIGCAATDEECIRKGQVFGLYEISTLTNIGFQYDEGRYYPINYGVYGRVLMANYEPREEMEKIVRSLKLEHYGGRSITDHDELLEEYDRIRSQNYAYCAGYISEGLGGVGAPVRNGAGRVIACIGAAVMDDTWDEQKKAEIIATIQECAGNVGILFPGDSGIV